MSSTITSVGRFPTRVIPTNEEVFAMLARDSLRVLESDGVPAREVDPRVLEQMRAAMPHESRVHLPTLHPAQCDIVETAKRFNVLECGRRFGKTVLGLYVAIAKATQMGVPVGWFAPTYKGLSEQWNEALHMSRDVIASMSKQERQLRFLGGGLIDFWSLENSDAGRGRKYALVVIDEASIVRELEISWTASIRPMLTDLRGGAWFLGTPKGRNYFHSLFLKGQDMQSEEWRSWRFATTANPYMSVHEVAGAKADLPEHIYSQEYEGVPADDAGNPFGLDAIRECTIESPTGGTPHVWGIDLAKSSDWTVCLALDGNGDVAVCDRWQGPWEQTIERLLRTVTTGLAFVDSTGVGDPIVEALQKRAPGRFEGFKFTSSSKQQLMEGLTLALQQRTIRVPRGVVLNELESFEYEYTRSGGVKYSAPSGLHDDAVCALALAVAAKRTRRAPGNLGILF